MDKTGKKTRRKLTKATNEDQKEVSGGIKEVCGRVLEECDFHCTRKQGGKEKED